MITFREIEKRDLRAVQSLLVQLGYDTELDELEDRIQQIKKNNHGIIIVAVNSTDEIIACVHVLIDTRLAEGSFGEIVSLVVDKNHRGNGTGKKLIDESVIWLRNNNVSKLRIRCNAIRNETHTLYENLDFTEKKTQKIYEIVLEKYS